VPLPPIKDKTPVNPTAEFTPVKVAPGATAVERMRNTMKQKFGEKNKYWYEKRRHGFFSF
jgi:hypothetical protein